MKYLKELFSSAAVDVFIELRGRESLLCQGYFRICGYSPEQICISGGEHKAAVSGSGLTLRHLSEDAIAIDGRIDKIEFI